jgi:hypothetical protein
MSTGSATARRALVLASLLLAACSGKDSSRLTGNTDAERFTFSFEDPAGDTLAHPAASGGRGLDVIGVSGAVQASNIVLTIAFTRDVSLWTAGQPNSIDGFLDLDLDENSATGIEGAAGEYGGNAPLGAEFYLSLRDNGAGSVALVRASDREFWAVPAEVSLGTMRVTVPRTLLGDPDGEFRLSLVVGRPDLPATDFAPSTGYYTVNRP